VQVYDFECCWSFHDFRCDWNLLILLILENKGTSLHIIFRFMEFIFNVLTTLKYSKTYNQVLEVNYNSFMLTLFFINLKSNTKFNLINYNRGIFFLQG
jgi:hypothetical protein